MSAESAMLKARAQLLMDQPFFGTLAIKLKLVADPEVKTAATDGSRLLYAPDFISKLDPIKLRGLIAHEVMHCVFNHMTRRQERDKNIWNAACDFAINDHLVSSGFVLPDGALLSKDYHDMSAEEIYNRIKDDAPKPCAWGIVLDSGSGTVESGSSAALESEWQVAVTQAAEVARQRGKLPANLVDFISEIINPLVDWRSVLWPFCQSLINDDYTWRKPNRAYISEDEYLPSMHNEAAGHLVIIADSSGSCREEYPQFMSEMAAIHSDLTPEKVTILHVDAAVQHVKEVERYDQFPIDEMKGGGGTRFSPAFNWINEHAPDADAVVYLTDLESDDFGEAPYYPVLWVSTNKKLTAPFGDVVYM
jgi:predicted metal-dependent peptidase